MDHLLRVVAPIVLRDDDVIGDDVVDIVGAERSGIAQILHLESGRAQRKDAGPAAPRQAR